MPKPKIVFDFDQTLAFRDGKWTATIFEIVQENGYTQIDIEDIRKYVKSCFLWDFYEIPHSKLLKEQTWWEYQEKFVEKILMNNKITQSEASRLSKFIKEKYLNKHKWFLYEDTFQVLEELNNLEYECYILSNHTPELEELVIGLEIKKFIKKVYNSAFIGYEKPNSNIYGYMINDLNASPSEIIMIGDNYIADVVGSRSNCINSILVRSENANNYTHYSKDLVGVLPIIKQFENDFMKSL